MKRTNRTKVNRKPKRSCHDIKRFLKIVREARVGHLAFNYDESVHSIPMLCWHMEGFIYFHASVAGRIAELGRTRAEVCISFTILDGLVLAKSAIHHSANYRSAVIYANCQLVQDNDEKFTAMNALMNTVDPSRWNRVRYPNENELNAVCVIKVPVNEFVVKERMGPAQDKEGDLLREVWTGVIPINHQPGSPEPDQYCNDSNTPVIAS